MRATHKVSKTTGVFFLFLATVALCLLAQAGQAPARQADVLVVGAGISGLSAALEAGRGGASVVVVDMFSVFGGHAVMSTGGVLIVGSPEQQARGIEDSPELAFNDFMRYGEDAQAEWARAYVQGSRSEVYDWLTALGVRFSEIEPVPGNSVPRFHNTEGRGLGLVSPIYREGVKHPNIRFEWNTQITGLLVDRGQVVGATGKNVRSGEKRQFRARAVILATGGFQSNLALVRDYWPKNLPFPERMLVGAGLNAVGSGLALAQRAGGLVRNTDHQWNYPYGLPDPRYPASNRGLNASNPAALWVNVEGKRFVNELASVKEVLPALLHQTAATYWMILDAEAKPLFWVSGTDWAEFRRIEELILGNANLTKTADTLEELAAATGLPAASLAETIRRYNEMVTRGHDTDFGRFGPGLPADPGIPPLPPRGIARPPFYAIQFFPLTRKSMGACW